MYQFTYDTEQCAVCKSLVRFQSNASNLSVCSICNSVMLRKEAQGMAETIGMPAGKAVTRGIVQPGTKGEYKGGRFTVLGGLDCDMGSYRMHRWNILFSDGKKALLTEVEGFYAILEKANIDVPGKIKIAADLPVGIQRVDFIGKQAMYAADRSRCERMVIRGEVASMNTSGQFTITELVDQGNDRIEILEYAKGCFEVNHLTYVPLDYLRLTNTITPVPANLELRCDKCSRPVKLPWPAYTKHCVCPACEGWNELTNDNQLAYRNKQFAPFEPVIPVGSKGTVKGIQYEVIGAIKKNEAGSINTYWTEYTLFNPGTGFAFLAEYNGHWTYLKEVKIGEQWPEYKEEISIDGEPFVKFNEYGYNVVSAAGCFNQALSGGNLLAKEFISPPEMYAAENDGGKCISWFKGEHITKDALVNGLQLQNVKMPWKVGVGAVQPLAGAINRGLLTRLTGLAVVVLIIIQVIVSTSSEHRFVLRETYSFPDTATTHSVVSPSFELKQGSSNLEFTIEAPVSNSWIATDVTLVNERTGKEYNFEKGVEYYSGYSGGESWSEGSQQEDEMLSSIPAGPYHLNIIAMRENLQGAPFFNMVVANDVPMWRNFFIILLMLLIYPAIMWWRTNSFEQRRWNG